MSPLAFLCFSLLALGKIEVIVSTILICNAVVNVRVRDPDNWKVESPSLLTDGMLSLACAHFL
jgi:hypothetical protein